MTKTLTEQWRDGTLPDGHYYVQYDKCSPFIKDAYGMIELKRCIDAENIKVLAPVPGYDEYQQLVSKTDQLEKRLEVSEKEHYRTLEQLRIATGALRETKDRLLKIELSNLNYEERHKLYDVMFVDGVIDRALLEMEGVK